MNFLLDTNVVSEWVKPRPNAGVVAWLAEVDEDRVFLSVVALAELRYGIERMAAGKWRSRLAEWLRDELTLRFEARVLPIDNAMADAWGKIMARGERPMSVTDAFIAATVKVHALTLVTCNADFAPALKAIVNPWAAPWPSSAAVCPAGTFRVPINRIILLGMPGGCSWIQLMTPS